MSAALSITLIVLAAAVGVAVTLAVTRRRSVVPPVCPTAETDRSATDLAVSRLTELAADYLTAIDDYNRLTARKLKVKQGADLLRLAESGSYVREQSARFETAFDKTVLTLWPDFTERVNALLAPDRQLIPAGEGQLNTELRLLAFMRLGFDDSSRIARLLGLTLNTIYTYRNKAKSRALNRDTFEADIHAIG
ncbi:MAG: hypothetical protein K2K84_04660 [Muribaculaceae bacterium]|nr:hypothetical protein [Muribaculaceae bacterium]